MCSPRERVRSAGWPVSRAGSRGFWKTRASAQSGTTCERAKKQFLLLGDPGGSWTALGRLAPWSHFQLGQKAFLSAPASTPVRKGRAALRSEAGGEGSWTSRGGARCAHRPPRPQAAGQGPVHLPCGPGCRHRHPSGLPPPCGHWGPPSHWRARPLTTAGSTLCHLSGLLTQGVHETHPPHTPATGQAGLSDVWALVLNCWEHRQRKGQKVQPFQVWGWVSGVWGPAETRMGWGCCPRAAGRDSHRESHGPEVDVNREGQAACGPKVALAPRHIRLFLD